jgi:hypothetical protein
MPGSTVLLKATLAARTSSPGAISTPSPIWTRKLSTGWKATQTFRNLHADFSALGVVFRVGVCDGAVLMLALDHLSARSR